MSRFKSLSDLKKEAEEAEKKDRESYVGGAASGQVTQDRMPPGAPGGPSGSSHADQVKALFEAAKANGAQGISESEMEAARKAEASFSGSGYRLGTDRTAADPGVPVAAMNRTGPPKPVRRTLTFWKTGFTVDDGPLRRLDDPANAEFLSDINKGIAPIELMSGNAPVEINLVDKKTEDYKPPPAKPFSGSGNKLGSTSTSVTAPPPPSSATGAPAVPPPPLDESKPVTSIQIRLADGSRLVAKFNHDAPVSAIRSFINASSPGAAATPYQLMTTFPRKTLDDESQTLSAAGLIGAVVVQNVTG